MTLETLVFLALIGGSGLLFCFTLPAVRWAALKFLRRRIQPLATWATYRLQSGVEDDPCNRSLDGFHCCCAVGWGAKESGRMVAGRK